MKNKELTATLGLLKNLLADPKLGTAHRETLRKGQRELEKISKSGKLDQRRVFRAISLISSTLVDMLPETEAATQSDDPTVTR